MYLSFYRLHNAPFNLTPDPAFLYWTPAHQEAYAALVYGVDAQKGFVALIGEVGCGKTTVLRNYLDQADPERVKAIYLINPEQEFSGVLRTMLGELGISVPDGDTERSVEALHQYLLESHKQDRRVVLIVDEAQRMPAETMERLRVLSNLETAKAKLLQIVLCGQSELETLLAREDLRQIRERIAVRAHIGPLTPAESRSYLRHRIECAGGHIEQLFSRSAIKEIVRCTKGNPRLLNVLCDNTLIAGFANRERPVKRRTVQTAVESIGQYPVHGLRKHLVPVMALLSVVLGGMAIGFLAKGHIALPGEQARVVDSARVIHPPVVPEAPPPPTTETEKTMESIPASNAVVDSPTVSMPPATQAETPDQTPTQPVAVIPENEKSTTASKPEMASNEKTVVPPEKGVITNESSIPELTVVPETPMAIARASVSGTEMNEVKQPESSALPVTVSTQPVQPDQKPEGTAAAANDSDLNHVWITVAPGDNIGKLVARINGRAHKSLIRRALAINPEVADANLIRPGQRVAIPILTNRSSEPENQNNTAPPRE